ncbi:SH3 domain-containing protein [Rhizobium ruizarguesonis]
MIKRLCIAIAMVFAMVSMAAAATVAVATGNVNLRAGPSTGYPVVVVVPVGARIVTHGCLPGYTWCDIGFASYRGWVSARYVQVVYNGAPVVLSPAVATTVGVTVVAFNKAYWDSYYVSYPWYRSWSVYAAPPRAVYGAYPRARVDSYGRSVECADGSCTANRWLRAPATKLRNLAWMSCPRGKGIPHVSGTRYNKNFGMKYAS